MRIFVIDVHFLHFVNLSNQSLSCTNPLVTSIYLHLGTFLLDLGFSANFEILETIPSSISLKYIVKSNGISTDSCRTLLVNRVQAKVALLITTLCLLFLNQFFIQWVTSPVNPNAWALYIKSLYVILWKAFWIYKCWDDINPLRWS